MPPSSACAGEESTNTMKEPPRTPAVVRGDSLSGLTRLLLTPLDLRSSSGLALFCSSRPEFGPSLIQGLKANMSTVLWSNSLLTQSVPLDKGSLLSSSSVNELIPVPIQSATLTR